MTGPLAGYDFLPWVRRGAAVEVRAADPLTGALPRRAALDVVLTVDSSGTGAPSSDTRTTKVELHGPGDVVGIDPRHIIRTDPPHLTPAFESNYLVAVEFDQPHFPWMYTPAGPAAPASPANAVPNRLRPWLSLVVLADGEYTYADREPHPLRAITVKNAKTLPDLGESWAWAHAQVAGGVDAQGLEAMLANAPGRVTSRILSPRRLRPDTHYTAFLVPAFDVGVAAGLGVDAPSGTNASPAWDATKVDLLLPFYFSFEFHTSSLGDFESLVRKLEPRLLPPEVGIRPMSVDQPGWGMPDAGGPLGLSGALRSPQTSDTVWSGSKRDDFRRALETSLNKGVAIDDPMADPVVTPPIYGRWHAAARGVDQARPGWVNELNLDPRTRVMAGFGTRVVLSQREHLLASAWKQVDGITEANRRLRQAQLARETSQKIYAGRLEVAESDRLLTLTAPVQKRMLASPKTIHATIERSRLPVHALSAAFRRITRAGGPIARRSALQPTGSASIVSRLNSGEIDPIPPPGRVIGLEDVADGLYPQWLPATFRRWLPHAFRVLVALALIAALLILLLGWLGGWWTLALSLAAVVAGALIALALLSLRFERRWRAADSLRFDHITPEAFDAAPTRPNFSAAHAGQDAPAGVGAPLGAPDSAEAARFRDAGRRLAEALQAKQAEPPTLEPADIEGLAATILTRLDPDTTAAARIGALLSVGDTAVGGTAAGPAIVNGTVVAVGTAGDPLDEIMAAPEFPQAMYAPLRDLSQALLLPGLDQIPPDTVALLTETHAFIEAYMVGLNHEMSRQLLADGYPTDQRGSYFRQFWDVKSYVPTTSDPTDPAELRERLKDVPPLHEWLRTRGLGANMNRPALNAGNLVLLVRGALLMRYPHATVYAVEAVELAGKRALGTRERYPLFTATLSPDVTLIGFDLTESEARGSTAPGGGHGWFIVFQQNPSAPHFGFEPAPEPYAVPAVGQWNQLSWANFAETTDAFEKLEHLPGVTQPRAVTIVETPGVNPGDSLNGWGHDAAQTAFISLVRPVRVGIHADAMLP